MKVAGKKPGICHFLFIFFYSTFYYPNWHRSFWTSRNSCRYPRTLNLEKISRHSKDDELIPSAPFDCCKQHWLLKSNKFSEQWLSLIQGNSKWVYHFNFRYWLNFQFHSLFIWKSGKIFRNLLPCIPLHQTLQ